MKFRIAQQDWRMSVRLLLHVALLTAGVRACQNGIQQPDGTCECFSCWKGEDCSIYATSPKFPVSHGSVSLTKKHSVDDVLYTASVIDPDQEFCKGPAGCSCFNVTYSIVKQEPDAIFNINTISGEVFTTVSTDHGLFQSYKVTIAANDDGSEVSRMSLSVTVDDGDDAYGYGAGNPDMPFMNMANEGELLSRHKRSVQLPDEIDFELTKVGDNKDETTMKVGTKYSFQLMITMPDGSTTLSVELFTPDFDFTVMMLCDVAVTVGSQIVPDSSEVEMDSVNNNTQYDRAVIDFGTITNSAGSTMDDSRIYITYSAVMIYNSQTADNTEYWVSAGAEYANSANVWIGQASLTAETADDEASFTDAPDVTVTGPNELMIGESAIYSVTAKVYAPYSSLKFNVFGGVNSSNAMGVCGSRLTSWGPGYSCGNEPVETFSSVETAEGDSIGTGRSELDLGTPINSMARLYLSNNSNPEGEFTISVLARMYDNPDNVDGVFYLGFSLEIGSSVLWVAQTAVTAKAYAAAGGNPTVVSAIPSGDDSVSLTKPCVIELNLDLSPSSTGDYIVEVTTGTELHVCALTISSSGANVPCLNPMLEAVYESSDPSSGYVDKARMELGIVNSVGTWSNESNANIITLSAAVKSTSAASDNTNYDVTFTIYKDGVQLTSTVQQVETKTADAASAITAENTPVVSLSFGGDGSDTVMVGKTVKLLADIQTFPDTLYMPFNIEAIMPNNSGVALGRICKVTLETAGLNTPCMLSKVVDEQTQYLSSWGDGVQDRAVLDMDGLSNLGLYNSTGADNFAIGVSFVMEDNAIYSTDDEHWISLGLSYSSTNLWIGQTLITVDTSASIAALTDAPNLEIVTNNGNLTSVPLGYPAKFLARIKLRPADFTVMTVNVSTTDDFLSVCSVRLARAGNGYPCITPDPISLVTDYDPLVYVNRKGSIDLGYVGNVGSDLFVADTYFDENTVEVEVTAMVKRTASNGAQYNLQVDVNYDSGHATSITAQGTVTATTTIDPEVTAETTISSSVTSDAANLKNVSITGVDEPATNEVLDQIVLSESKRLVFEYETERNKTRHMQIKVKTHDSSTKKMEVVYMGIQDYGSNLGCVSKEEFATAGVYSDPSTRGFNDEGMLDLGYVCNSGLVNDTVADMIRVEIVVRLLPDSVVSVGETLTTTVSLLSNTNSLIVLTFDHTVADVVSYVDFEKDGLVVNNNTGIQFNSTEPALVLKTAEIKMLPLVFTVPPYTSSKVQLDVEMPVNTSAVITFMTFTIVKAGRSLHRLTDFTASYLETVSSQYNTSQMTKYELDLGVITNTGVTQNLPDYTVDDDTFSAELTVQMADSELAVTQAAHTISVGMSAAKFVFILDFTVSIDRTTHDLEFNMTSEINALATTLDHIEVDTNLSLADTSTAEGQNAVLVIYHPPYVSCQSSIVGDLKTLVSESRTANSLQLNFGPIFFTDAIQFKTVLQSNSSAPVPVGITGSDSVVIFQPIADEFDTANIAGEMQYINITVSTTVEVGGSCSPSTLGMQDSSIADCQITSSPNSITDATNARYSVGSGWSPFVHTGDVMHERYLQVYFGNKVMVNTIKMQQLTSVRVTAIQVRYSNDGIAWWENSANLIQGIDTAIADQDLAIQVPEPSRYIRVMIHELDDNTQQATFRFEFIGCATTSDGPASPCTAVTSPLTDFKPRTFLNAGSTLYVCDGIQGNFEIKQKCYSSSDNLNWKELDERVGSLIGYEADEPRVYAMSQDGLKYMSSTDGDVWYTSVPSDVTIAKTLNFKAATEVPLTDDTNLNVGNPHSSYQDHPYGATMVGVKHDSGGGTWSTVFSWSQCCP